MIPFIVLVTVAVIVAVRESGVGWRIIAHDRDAYCGIVERRGERRPVYQRDIWWRFADTDRRVPFGLGVRIGEAQYAPVRARAAERDAAARQAALKLTSHT